MDYFVLKEFLSSYSLPSIVIALSVSVFYFFALKFFIKNLPQSVKTQLPFLTAVALYFAYDMIFLTKTFAFRDSAFIAGVLSGSLSVIFSSIIKKLKRGEVPSLASKTALIIEGLLEGIIPPTQIAATALAVEKLLVGITEDDDVLTEKARRNVQSLIAERAVDTITELELYSVSKLIVQSTLSI